MAAAEPVYLPGGEMKEDRPVRKGLQTQMAPDTATYDIIKFKNTPSEGLKDSLRSKGVEFKSYVPNGWIVRLDGVDRGQVRNEEEVAMIRPYRSGYKVSSSLSSMDASGGVNVTVSFFGDVEGNLKPLKRFGTPGRKISPTEVELSTSTDHLPAIADLSQVKSVTPSVGEPTTLNDDSRRLLGVGELQASPYNLKGDGFTAGVWDSGWGGKHEDLNYTGKRVIGDNSSSGSITCDGNCGVDDHATHVAGTLLGAGRVDKNYRGMAPEARLITYEWPTSGSSEVYAETNESIVEYGNVVSQNSWSFTYDSCDNRESFLYGNYYSFSNYYDKLVSGETSEVEGKIPVVFSAGNDRQACAPTYNTTTRPVGAKNVITVGSVDANLNSASYSSWGPTDDGRIKPTVVSHGGDYGTTGGVYSTYPSSSLGYPYSTMQGTSMAAPSVSGMVVLLTQKFNRTFGRRPDPATVKALLVHNADDLNRTGPDYVTGWGIPNGTETIDYVEESRYAGLMKTDSLDRKENRTYDVNVSSGGSANFTLVWSDYPAPSGSGDSALVNDLDLVIKNSTGHRYYPWTLNWSIRKQKAVRTKPDRRNPVEQVYIPEVEDETLTVTVNATDVPQGPQSYTLLMSSKVQNVPDLDVRSPQNTTYSSSPELNVSSSSPLRDAKYSIDGGKNRSMSNTSERFFYDTKTDISEGLHTVRFWIEYRQGEWSYRTVDFTIDETAPFLSPQKPVEGGNISGMQNVSAVFYDDISGVMTSPAFIENSTDQLLAREVNFTFNFSRLSHEGPINITYIAQDNAGNVNRTKTSAVVDNTPPEITSHDPVAGEALRGNFSVNASYRDGITGLESSEFLLANSSGVQRSGALNRTLNSSRLANGDYTLSYRGSDYAGNMEEMNITVTVDNRDPLLNILNPENRSYVPRDFWVNASTSGTYSETNTSRFTLTNGSIWSTYAGFNRSIDTDSLSRGQYDIIFYTSDEAGNSVQKRINVTLDKTKPSLTVTSPEASETVTEDFDVNASFNDSLSGVDNADYRIINSSGAQRSGGLNDTLDSTTLSGGLYSLEIEVKDNAGNVKSVSREFSVDNSAPDLESASIASGDKISGTVDVEAVPEDVSPVQKSEFRWYNSSGNVTGWKSLNYTGFDLKSLADGIYNISYRLEDELGYSDTFNYTGVAVDNTDPQIQLTEYNTTEEAAGWYRDYRKIGVSCSDGLSGHESTGFYQGGLLDSSSDSSANFTADVQGNNSYSFRCSDQAGNTVSVEKHYAIDGQAPAISSINPGEGSTTGRNVTITVHYDNERTESGIDPEQSQLQASPGSIESLNWSNSSAEAEITGLSYSSAYEVTGQVVDQVGNSKNIELYYDTVSEPEDDQQTPSPVPANTSTNKTTQKAPEPSYEALDQGLKASNLNISEGVVSVDVSNYSSGTVEKIDLRGGSGLVGVEVEQVSRPGTEGPSGVVANRFVRMDLLNSSRVDNLSVVFGVQSDWLDSQGVSQDSVSLYRIEGSWQQIETSLRSEGDKVLYTAELQEFSEFGIAAEKACRDQSAYAVGPEESSCRQYSNSCNVPDSWSKVESCQLWERRQEAEEAIQNLSDRGVSEEKVESVREKYREGNYSGALQVAQNIRETDKGGGSILIPLLTGFILLGVLTGGSLGGYIYYRRYTLEQEIEDLGEEIITKADSGEIDTENKAVDHIIQAKQALNMNNYEKARQKVDRYREEARGKDLPLPEEL